MAYEVTTWNKLVQYLVEWIFVSHTGRKFVNKKKISSGPQRTNKNFSCLELIPQHVMIKTSYVSKHSKKQNSEPHEKSLLYSGVYQWDTSFKYQEMITETPFVCDN